MESLLINSTFSDIKYLTLFIWNQFIDKKEGYVLKTFCCLCSEDLIRDRCFGEVDMIEGLTIKEIAPSEEYNCLIRVIIKLSYSVYYLFDTTLTLSIFLTANYSKVKVILEAAKLFVLQTKIA